MPSSILQKLFFHRFFSDGQTDIQTPAIIGTERPKREVPTALKALTKRFNRQLTRSGTELPGRPKKLQKRPKSSRPRSRGEQSHKFSPKPPLLPRIPSVASAFRKELVRCRLLSSKESLIISQEGKQSHSKRILVSCCSKSSAEDAPLSGSAFQRQDLPCHDVVQVLTTNPVIVPARTRNPKKHSKYSRRKRQAGNQSFKPQFFGQISKISDLTASPQEYDDTSAEDTDPDITSCFPAAESSELVFYASCVPRAKLFSMDKNIIYDLMLQVLAPSLSMITAYEARRSTTPLHSVVSHLLMVATTSPHTEEKHTSLQFVIPPRHNYKARNRHVSLISAPEFTLSSSSRYSSISDATKQSSDYGEGEQNDIVQCIQLSSPNQLSSAHALPTDDIDPSCSISSFMKSIVLPAAVVDEIQSKLMSHDAQIAEEVYERKQAQTNAWVEQKLKEEAIRAFEMAQNQHAKALNEISEMQIELKGWRLIADIEERVHTRMTADLMRQLQAKEEHIERLTAALEQAPPSVQKQVVEVEQARDRIFALETAAIQHSYNLEDKDLEVRNVEALAKELESERCRLDNEVDAVKIELELMQAKEAEVQDQLARANQELEESRTEANRWQKMLEEHVTDNPNHSPDNAETIIIARLRQQLDQATTKATCAEQTLFKATETLEDLRYENRLHLGRLHFETELTEWWVSDKLANVQAVFEENEALKGRFARELEADPLVLPDDLYVTQEFERPGPDHLTRSVALSRAQQSSHDPKWSQRYAVDRVYGVYGWSPDGGPSSPPEFTEEEDLTEPEGFWDRYELRKQRKAEMERIGGNESEEQDDNDDDDDDDQAFADAEMF